MTFQMELIVIKYDAMQLLLACIFLQHVVVFVLNSTGTKYSAFPENSIAHEAYTSTEVTCRQQMLSQWVGACAS